MTAIPNTKRRGAIYWYRRSRRLPYGNHFRPIVSLRTACPKAARRRAAILTAKFEDLQAGAWDYEFGNMDTRAGEALYDKRLDRTFEYTGKHDVEESIILGPDHAPEWMFDREMLWNTVEDAERHKRAQLAREFDIALPIEFVGKDPAAAKEALKGWAADMFVAQGLMVDINFHNMGGKNPHAHVMTTMRRVHSEAMEFQEESRYVFEDTKARDQNDWGYMDHRRETWADYANAAMADPRVDLPDLERFFAAMLDLRGRRLFRRDDGLEVKTPGEWLAADYALKDRYSGLVFDRALAAGAEGATRVLGVGHRLFDRALAEAERLSVVIARCRRLDAPLLLIAIEDEVTGTGNSVGRIVVGAQLKEDGNVAILRDWETLLLLNRIAPADEEISPVGGAGELVDRALAATAQELTHVGATMSRPRAHPTVLLLPS